MAPSPPQSYLGTEILTAPPQKLHLMLIEGAIRFAQRAREHWRASQYDQACEALIRAQDILSEMMAAVNRKVDAELAKKTAAVYLFIFRRLMEANMRRDEAKLDDALRVLEIERETWRLVCERLAGSGGPAGNQAGEAPWVHSAAAGLPAGPPLGVQTPLAEPSPGSFSAEA